MFLQTSQLLKLVCILQSWQVSDGERLNSLVYGPSLGVARAKVRQGIGQQESALRDCRLISLRLEKMGFKCWW